MGSSQSTNNTEINKYTDAEIQQNLTKLFNTNRNNFSEASFPIENLTEGQQGGSNIKFNSSKNRHLKHNINDLQEGGDNANFESEQSEFAKIKEFLLKEASNNQTGGADNVYESISSISGFDQLKEFMLQDQNQQGSNYDSVTSSFEPSKSFKNGQFGGEESEGETMELPESEEVEEKKEEEEDSERPQERTRKAPKRKTTKRKTPKRKTHKRQHGGLSSTSDVSVNIRTEKLSPTSMSTSTKYSSTSQVLSSELNIVPFYSSDSSNTHPYTKNMLQ